MSFNNIVLLVPLGYKCYLSNLVVIGLIASAEMSFENVDGRQRPTIL